MKRRRTIKESLPGLRRILARFAPYIRQQRWLIVLSLLALVAEVALRALEPVPLKFVFDHVIGNKSHGRVLLPWIQTLDPYTIIGLSALAIVVLTGLRALADYGNTIGFALVANRVLSQVRIEVYRHLQGLSLSFHTKARGGDLVLRVMNDVNMLKDVAVTAALPLLANVLILLGMMGVMFWIQWKLALVAFAFLPLLWLWTTRLGRRIQQAARNQRKRESAMAATAAESIGAIKLIQTLCLEGVFADSFWRRNRDSQKEDVKGARLAAALGRTVGFLIAMSTALVLWYGARLALSGELSPGDLVIFLAYLKNAYRPIQEFAKYTGRLAKATAAGERVLDLLDRTPEVRDLPGAQPAARLVGAVHFEGVSFSYEAGRPVLDRIDFAVEPGRHVALVGPSGIGKSTIVSLMLRLYDPMQGRVLIDGHDIREYTLASLRSQISVVLQDTLLFAASIRDNIAYGALNASSEEIEAAARLANAHEFIQNLPAGYDTTLGERGVTLSVGQRQRIAIARAAVSRAPILILDEPATGLDEENQRAVLEALERLAQGRTTFFITHDLQHAARADLILYLEHGRVFERGTQEELLHSNGRYASLYRLQNNGLVTVESRHSVALVH
jgi:ATP-binding cassette, subfamily B, bacterial